MYARCTAMPIGICKCLYEIHHTLAVLMQSHPAALPPDFHLQLSSKMDASIKYINTAIVQQTHLHLHLQARSLFGDNSKDVWMAGDQAL